MFSVKYEYTVTYVTPRLFVSLCSAVVRAPACHAGDPGSSPRQGIILFPS